MAPIAGLNSTVGPSGVFHHLQLQFQDYLFLEEPRMRPDIRIIHHGGGNKKMRQLGSIIISIKNYYEQIGSSRGLWLVLGSML